MEKLRVLFLCTSNSARSQMAEAFLRHYAGDRFEAYSAGLYPTEIHPLTRQVMGEVGIDIGNQYAKHLKEYMGQLDFAYLIAVCSEADAQCPAFPGMGQRLHWDLEDPVQFAGTEEEALVKFREVRDWIRQLVQEWADSIGDGMQ